MKIKFDQHFLKNKEILQKEIEICDINKNDVIVEIGPGDGRLTELILEANPQKLIAIEMDENLEPELKKLKSENTNFKYVIGNAVDEIKSHEFSKLISNIPYSITEPLYKYLMKEKIEFSVLLHGEKFYKQILSKTSKWYYFVNSFYNVNLIEEVEGKEFEPQAKVKSVLLKLELKKKLNKEDKFFQALFQRENRNTKNALIYSLVEIGFSKKDAKEIVEDLKLNKKTSSMEFQNISNKSFTYIIENIKKNI